MRRTSGGGLKIAWPRHPVATRTGGARSERAGTRGEGGSSSKSALHFASPILGVWTGRCATIARAGDMAVAPNQGTGEGPSPGQLARAQLALSITELECSILALEFRLLKKRRQPSPAAEECASSSRSSETSQPKIEGNLRERRMQISRAVTAPAGLHIELGASWSDAQLAQQSQSNTAFFSPSCHDWSKEQLLTSREWTPFASPRRCAVLSGGTQPKRWPSVLQTTDANRRA